MFAKADIFCTILLLLGIGGKLARSKDPSEFKCTEEFCLEFQVEHAALCALPDVMKCNNESLALLLPQANECNCCDSCLQFLKKGDGCINGSPGMLLPNVMCGPGLKCVNQKCVELPSEEEDPLNTQGNYNCIDGICHCIAHEGEVIQDIFGTFLESEIVDDLPQCKCSENFHTAQNKLAIQSTPWNRTELTSRCLPNGQFDPLQCFEDYCVCIDQNLGTYDDTIPVVPISRLGPGSPLCFDAEKFNHTRIYFKECEKMQRLLQLARDFADTEGFVFMFPFHVECTADGEYAEEVSGVAVEALRAMERTWKSSRSNSKGI